MDVRYFDFSMDGKQYRFWAWKGDYLNLGAGAEMGIYFKTSFPGQWGVDRMTVVNPNILFKNWINDSGRTR